LRAGIIIAQLRLEGGPIMPYKTAAEREHEAELARRRKAYAEAKAAEHSENAAPEKAPEAEAKWCIPTDSPPEGKVVQVEEASGELMDAQKIGGRWQADGHGITIMRWRSKGK
jgi:hypothetical protein